MQTFISTQQYDHDDIKEIVFFRLREYEMKLKGIYFRINSNVERE